MAALPNAPRAANALPPASVPGFTIRLPCAQLGDLIQINCINRVHGAFYVSSGAGEGHLFFHGGQLVHAACGDQLGLDAVVVMLGWRGGSIEPCALPWPAQISIGMGADVLLLRAAQRLDERSRRDAARGDLTTKVVRRVSWPDEPSAREPAPDMLGDGAAEFDADAATREAGNRAAGAFERSAEARTPDNRSSEHSGLVLKSVLSVETLSRLEVTRVTPDGDIQTSRAGASTDLADTAFFCQRLASLIGESLGLGACRALACENAKEGIVVFKGRSIVGARGERKDLELIIAKVGLM
jgi:Domain of unknown function (DUF4388)